MLKKKAFFAIKAWCLSNGHPANQVRHLYPRAYVVGRAAPYCLIVARPWQDSEPQCKDFDKLHPLVVVYRFDKSLDAGMWCVLAYVISDLQSENVAIPFEV